MTRVRVEREERPGDLLRTTVKRLLRDCGLRAAVMAPHDSYGIGLRSEGKSVSRAFSERRHP
jgi:hypothetical protein